MVKKGTEDIQLVNKNGNRGSIPMVRGILASLKYVHVWLEKEAQMTMFRLLNVRFGSRGRECGKCVMLP